MRFIWLCLVGLLSWLIATAYLFPAAPVVDRIRPQLGTVALEGVQGKLYKGVVDRVRSTDDLLPLEFRNVGWTLAPQTLINGGAGVTVRFDGYGGEGHGQVMRLWNGDVAVNDFVFNAQAKALEVLLPVPVAAFAGELVGEFDEVVLKDNLLDRMRGELLWRDAMLERPVPTSLGTVNVVIEPQAEQQHMITLSAVGGDVTMEGSVTMSLNGDFVADVLFTPTDGASPDVINGLRQMGRADANGRVRFRRDGNVNRLM